MIDVFISYKSSDRERIQTLVKALEQKGWSVWWDRDIPPGKTFDQVIEEAMDAAKCVIVVWSKESVLSEWVKTEAAEGARRGILIPVLIDDVKIPLEFRRIQAASLVDWKGTLSHPGFDQLSEAIASILGRFPNSVLSGIQEQGAGGKEQEAEPSKQEREEHEARDKADRVGAERKTQEEPPAFYQQKVEVPQNKGIPAQDQPKNWSKIIGGAGIVALIIAALIVYKEVTKEVKVTVSSPKIDYFKAIPETVEKGGKSNLSWNTSNAKEVFLNKESVALSGSQDVTPEKSTTYTLIAKNEKGEEIEKKVSVEVNIPPSSPEIRNFKAVPKTVEKGKSSNLSWEISNAKEVTIDNGIGKVELSGSQDVTPEKSTTYTLVAKNEKGEEIEKKVTVEVSVPLRPPEILDFGAKPPTIKKGDATNLSWQTSNAKEVYINKERVDKLSGSQDVRPEKTTIYTLVVTSEEGKTVQREVTVEVKVSIPSPEIIGFSAKPPTIKRGENSRLIWETSNASEVFLNRRKVKLSGSQDVSPESTTTYALIAKSEEGGTIERKVTVRVGILIQPPKLDLKTIPEVTKKGVEEQETRNFVGHPEQYIKITDWSFFVAFNGVAMIHHVKIENTSGIAYKDIKVRLHYFSGSGIEVSGETKNLPVTIPPHSKEIYLKEGFVLGGGSSSMHAGNIEVLGAVPLAGE